MTKISIKELTISASMLALAVAFAVFFHMAGINAAAFSPLHIPVFLTGMVCGAYYGGVVGAIVPYIAFLLTGGPPVQPPVAVAMSLELLMYGVVCGLVMKTHKLPQVLNVYTALIAAQVIGRIFGGALFAVLPKLSPMSFAGLFTMYFSGTLPAIILQLVLIPPIVIAIKKRP